MIFVLSPSARELAQRLGGTLAGHDFRCGRPVTASWGVAELEAGDDLRALQARADEALYRAKLAGRNTVRAAGED